MHWLPGGDAGVVACVIGGYCGGLCGEGAQAAFGAHEHAGIECDLLAQQILEFKVPYFVPHTANCQNGILVKKL